MTCTIHQSPYITEHPIRDEFCFYGRERLLLEIQESHLSSDDNVRFLYGQRRIGKSSCLLQLQRAWQVKGFDRVAYFDFAIHSDLSVGQILCQIACALSDQHHLPQTDKSRFDDDGEFFFAEFLPRIVESGHTYLLLFDGCDILDSPEKTAPLHPLLRQFYVWGRQFNTFRFVFTLRQHPENFSYFPSMFKVVDPVEIQKLSYEDTEQLIRISEINPVSLCWESEAVERVWHVTKGHPYFTQLLCSEIWLQMVPREAPGIPLARAHDVEDGVAKVLQNRTDACKIIWDDVRPFERIMLSIVAQDANKGDEPGVSLEEFAESLERFHRTGILLEDEDGYHLDVPLVKKWIVENAPPARLKNELVETLTHEVISIVSQAVQRIVAIWGDVPFFQDIVNRLPQEFMKYDRTLYLGINMREAKQTRGEDTLFRFIHVLGDSILQNIPDTESVNPLYKALYRLQKAQMKREIADSSETLREFVEFNEKEVYPAFQRALRDHSLVIIGLEHFDDVMEWGVMIRRFVLEVLSKNVKDLNVKCLLLARTAKEFSLHYGSDLENSSEDILLYELGRDRK